jgi:predicted acyl esterase
MKTNRSALSTFVSTALIFAAIALAPLTLDADQPKEGHETDSIGGKLDYTKFLADAAPGTKATELMIPMRDGIKLAATTFIPPGPGPFPVILSGGYYSRSNTTRAGKDFKDGNMVFIAVDARGVYDSEGKPRTDIKSADFEMNDISDTLNWVAAQSWCNGRIGMQGASGNGVWPDVGYLTRNPHLVMVSPSISTAYPYCFWGFSNGARKGLYNWLSNTGLDVSPFPAPTLPGYDLAGYHAIVEEAAKANPIIVSNSSGWYDISSEPVLDQFAAGAAAGKIFAHIGPGTHGGNPLYIWPKGNRPAGAVYAPKIDAVLLGKVKIPEKSQLEYYVMGNFRDPSTPGNFYKITDVWPVPSTPTNWYFQANGALSTTAPAADAAPVAYDYNPNDPAPSLGGNYTYLQPAGPQDERPLLTRKDVIHFVSDPLTDPVEITGKVRTTLFISTAAPDTEFVVKFTDVQPDGYEMIVRESATLGRFAKEFNGTPAPLEKGKVYQLDLDLWSTAIVFAKGHRIGVIVTSSSKDAYQVHPNSFTPVASLASAPIAHQQIYFSKDHPSCLTLPVVPLDPEATAPPAATPPPAPTPPKP